MKAWSHLFFAISHLAVITCLDVCNKCRNQLVEPHEYISHEKPSGLVSPCALSPDCNTIYRHSNASTVRSRQELVSRMRRVYATILEIIMQQQIRTINASPECVGWSEFPTMMFIADRIGVVSAHTTLQLITYMKIKGMFQT